MRSKFAILLAIAAVCATTAWAGWTSESLVTGSPGVWRAFIVQNYAHKVVYGTDGVGHLVWQGGPDAQPFPGIWYNRYNPGSGSREGYWTADFGIAPMGVTKKKKEAYSCPCIALDADGRTIHVVWSSRKMSPTCDEPDSLYYRRCTQDRKGNDKWDAALRLYAAYIVARPVVACAPNEPNHVLVCWRYLVPFQPSGYSIVTAFREYVNGAWKEVVRLDSTFNALQDRASIAVAPNGDVFVAYCGYDVGTSGQQIFVRTRHNGEWGEPVNVTKSFSSLWCDDYTIEVNPHTCNPHVVFQRWTEVPTGAGQDTVSAVYHTYRNASGAWLTTPKVISEPRRGLAFRIHKFAPTMAFVSDGAAHVVWSDTVPSTGGHGIWYSHCSGEGETWSTPELLTSSYTSSGQFITVEEPAHTIHVVWLYDYADRDEIWWKSSPLGGGFGGLAAKPAAKSLQGVDLFPNPATAGLVTVRYALPRTEPLKVTLLDVSGRTLRTQETPTAGLNGSLNIDVSGLSAGVYVARLVARDLNVSKLLVVER